MKAPQGKDALAPVAAWVAVVVFAAFFAAGGRAAIEKRADPPAVASAPR